jgi:endonuclease I
MDFELLLSWHEDYPVSLYEKHRNAAIQELQGNRNPFIDYPNLAAAMLAL